MTSSGSLQRKVLAALAMAGLSSAAFAGSSLTSGGTSWIASENNGGSTRFKVSVHPGVSGYSGVYDEDGKPPGEVVNEPFNDTVRAYRFWAVTKDSKRVETLTQSTAELGDASVPFDFDVHAMIYSEDAPNLEAALHRNFNDLRLNKINLRKEFFAVNIPQVQEQLDKMGIEAKWTLLAEARQYRESLAIKHVPQERLLELAATSADETDE